MTAMNRSNLEYYKDTQIDLATILRTLFDHKKLITVVVVLFTLLGLSTPWSPRRCTRPTR